MAITAIQWFQLSEGEDGKDELKDVLNFIEQVPDILEEIFLRQATFRDLVDRDVDRGINFMLFEEAFYEAKQTLTNSLEEFRFQVDTSASFRDEALRTLNRIGFRGTSLKLKANLFKKLWEDLNRWGGDFIDYTKRPIVKLVRKFVKFLNKLLDSLKILIPGLEAIKEFKDMGEEYVDLGEELTPD